MVLNLQNTHHDAKNIINKRERERESHLILKKCFVKILISLFNILKQFMSHSEKILLF